MSLAAASAPAPLNLVADVGGTNTRVALADGGTVRPDTVRRYPNRAHDGIDAVLRAYLSETGNPDCAGACVAVAGPVRDGYATLTNLDWSIDKAQLARATRAEVVAVLNDLQAQGHALGHIPADNLTRVLPGVDGGEHAAQLVVNVGTGFNAAPVYNTGTGRYVPPSEAGHSSLPVRSADDASLARFVLGKDGFASIEDILSGRGVGHCHAWAHAGVGADGPPLDAAGVIAALERGTDPVALLAGEVWVRMLGNVAGNLALHYLPFGGIYLVGGVARALSPWFERFDFAAAFRDKGRFSVFMEQFSVSIVSDDYAALTGCAQHLVMLE